MVEEQLVQRSRNSFTRLARFFNQLMREHLMCGPVTVQQCYTLEALVEGPKTMPPAAFGGFHLQNFVGHLTCPGSS